MSHHTHDHSAQDDVPQHNDDVLFDRLVDGELSADERRRLIASLDDRADGWRRCALSFLEAQSWGGAMRQMIAESAEPVKQLAPAETTPTEASSRRHASWTSYSWLAVAAGLLAAFSLGWQLKRPGAPQGADFAVESPRTVPLGPHRAGSGADDAITLVVRNEDGQPQRVRVPLWEGERLGQAFADAPQWAVPAVQKEFAERGLDLKARRRYAPLFFEQQDRMVPMIVPVDDAVITPVSRPIY